MCETMEKNGITPTDTKWVDVVRDYQRMKACLLYTSDAADDA